jgi:hypothetical protein
MPGGSIPWGMGGRDIPGGGNGMPGCGGIMGNPGGGGMGAEEAAKRPGGGTEGAEVGMVGGGAPKGGPAGRERIPAEMPFIRARCCCSCDLNSSGEITPR